MRRIIVVLFAMVAVAACSSGEPPLTTADAWARAPLPGRSTTAAYMTLSNNSGETLVIDRISSPQFGRVEVHDTEVSDGMLRMRKIDALRIAPGGSLALAPGGMHLMLMQPRAPDSNLLNVELSLFSGERPLAQLTLPVTETSPYDRS